MSTIEAETYFSDENQKEEPKKEDPNKMTRFLVENIMAKSHVKACSLIVTIFMAIEDCTKTGKNDLKSELFVLLSQMPCRYNGERPTDLNIVSDETIEGLQKIFESIMLKRRLGV